MKRSFLSVMLLVVSMAIFAQMPSVKVENEKGELINTTSLLDGKTPLIVSFWSTTCKPCIRELDAINEQLPDWLDEAQFKVVAVSVDDNRFTAKAHSLAQGHGWSDFTLP